MNGMPTDVILENFCASVREIAHGLNTSWKAANLNEAAVRQVVVLRLLQAAGFDIWNPLEVMPEVQSGARGSTDFLLRFDDKDALVLELKRSNATLADNETEQAITYAFHKGIRWAIITNGKVWKVCDVRIVTQKFNERVVLEIKLDDDIDFFAKNLFALLNRSVWALEEFEDSLESVKFALVYRELNKRLEFFMIKHEIANRSSAIKFMVNEGELTKTEQDILEKNQNFSSPKSTNEPDSALLDEINSASGRYTNDSTGTFIAQWHGVTLKPKSFRNLYLSLVEVAISRGITPRYATQEQIKKWPADTFAEISNGQKVDKNLNSETSRKRMKELLEALKVQPGTLEIQYTGKTYLLP
jgi:predicted type IV restriction endonuclease